MQGPAIGLAGFAAVMLLIVLRVPVGVAMGVVGAIGYGFVYGFSTLGFVLGRAPFDAVASVGETVETLRLLLRPHTIRWEPPDEPLTAIGDEARFRQVGSRFIGDRLGAAEVVGVG